MSFPNRRSSSRVLARLCPNSRTSSGVDQGEAWSANARAAPRAGHHRRSRGPTGARRAQNGQCARSGACAGAGTGVGSRSSSLRSGCRARSPASDCARPPTGGEVPRSMGSSDEIVFRPKDRRVLEYGVWMFTNDEQAVRIRRLGVIRPPVSAPLTPRGSVLPDEHPQCTEVLRRFGHETPPEYNHDETQHGR